MTATLRTLAIASALAVVCLPSLARAQDDSAPRRDTSAARTRPNRTMLKSGIVFLGVPYTASILVATTSDRRADKNLYIPVAGPWMDLSSRDKDCQLSQTCRNEGLHRGLLIANGVFQGLGVLQVLGSFLFPDKVQAPNANGEVQKESVKVRVAPSSFAGGYGLVATGKFY